MAPFWPGSDELRGAVGRGGDHRQAAGQGLQDDVAARVIDGGQGQHPAGGIKILHRRLRAQKPYTRCDSKFIGQTLVGTNATLADDEQAAVPALHPGQGVDEEVQAFALKAGAHEEDIGTPRFQTQVVGGRGRLRRRSAPGRRRYR